MAGTFFYGALMAMVLLGIGLLAVSAKKTDGREFDRYFIAGLTLVFFPLFLMVLAYMLGL